MAESTANGTVFYTHQLPNGLQIVGQPMPDFESVAVSYYVRTGSRDEPDPGIAGVSHFLEHMVFKGTKTLDWQEITLEFNKIGAELNAFTSHESTVYYARVLGEYLERAVELLSDMMYPRLAESDFETEKEVIINEIARSEDQPYNLAFRRMMKTYFAEHPLGHDVLDQERASGTCRSSRCASTGNSATRLITWCWLWLVILTGRTLCAWLRSIAPAGVQAMPAAIPRHISPRNL